MEKVYNNITVEHGIRCEGRRYITKILERKWKKFL